LRVIRKFNVNFAPLFEGKIWNKLNMNVV
jgi:hypothetical protein